MIHFAGDLDALSGCLKRLIAGKVRADCNDRSRARELRARNPTPQKNDR